jgi:undecaprenyl-phosphate 4-deoxy-4-formamido-L-arabinose transferase
MMVPSISIVVPVYNSQQSLPLLLSRLSVALPALAQQYEAILVDDCSRDRSAQVMEELADQYPWLHCIYLLRNYGQHNALLCGIRQAQYGIVITMDDDLQNPPEEIPKLLEKLAEGCDAVYGYPAQESHGLLRDIASRMTKLSLQRAMGMKTASRVSSFRAFRTEVREGFRDYRGAFVSIDVLLGWGATKFGATPVENPPRTLGASNYTVSKLIAHAMNMVTGFTTLPLQFASILGFAFALFGLGVLAYVLAVFFIHGHSVPGFAFLASVIAIFSGVQLFALGIIGEYLARMHFRLMDRPCYTIRRQTERDFGAPTGRDAGPTQVVGRSERRLHDE